ncbi:TetR/AcrR family transcriptional regulator [Methanococcus sp. CF]
MDTRDLIIEKSRDIFFKRGYNETTLSEIAKECKISKGGLYHHFEKKEDLYKEVIISILKENEKIVLLCIEEDASFEESLFKFVEQMVMLRSRCFNYSEVTTNMAYSGPLSDAIRRFPELQNVNNNIYNNIIEQLVNRIILAQKMGEIRQNLDPYSIAIHFCSIFEGLPLLSYYMDKKFEEITKILFSSFWDLIKA